MNYPYTKSVEWILPNRCMGNRIEEVQSKMDKGRIYIASKKIGKTFGVDGETRFYKYLLVNGPS